ncbi:hypothetical protein DICVIV_01998 [Dictyocaulus viviparus]|uniref:Uncharacterized protein n=1 Tax=Dictyocaulus viviparus TaxID=29172 RepID=A0A0D8Y6J7_DICVI|nr:hypothetical protein DICVIV_01998 [Dictyocaulus viviparus]
MSKVGEKKIINDKIAKVREVVHGVSTNDIILALHSFDMNVERTIQAFCEGYLVVFLGGTKFINGLEIVPCGYSAVEKSEYINKEVPVVEHIQQTFKVLQVLHAAVAEREKALLAACGTYSKFVDADFTHLISLIEKFGIVMEIPQGAPSETIIGTLPKAVSPVQVTAIKHATSQSSISSSLGADSGVNLSPTHNEEKKPTTTSKPATPAKVSSGGIQMQSDVLSPDQLEALQRSLIEQLAAFGIDASVLSGVTAGDMPVRRPRKMDGIKRGAMQYRNEKASLHPQLSILVKLTTTLIQMGKSRQAFTKSDEVGMWMKLRKGDRMAFEPKGLKIWEAYVEERKVDRTPDSLSTRYRKHMSKNLHLACLQCHVIMRLYKDLRIVLTPEVKLMLERKFSIEIKLNTTGTLSTFKKVDHNISQRRELSPILNDGMCKTNLSTPVSNSTTSLLKRPSLNFTQEINDVMDSCGLLRRFQKLRNTTNVDISGTSNAHLSSKLIVDRDENGYEHALPGLPHSDISAKQCIANATNDTCTKALDCLCRLCANTSCSESTTIFQTPQMSTLTNIWRSYISKIVVGIGLNAEHSRKLIRTLFKCQEVALESSQSMQVVKAEVEDIMGNYMCRLKKGCRIPKPVIIVKDSDGFSRSSLPSVPVAKRKQCLDQIVNEIDLRLHYSQIFQILNGLENLDTIAAIVPEKYEEWMERVKETVKKNCKVHHDVVALP